MDEPFDEAESDKDAPLVEGRIRNLLDLGFLTESDDREEKPLDAWVLRAGQRVGRYRLVRQMGEGGFGLVWMAEQSEPIQREVALKLIKPGMDSRQVIARFEVERQTLAMMDHPNIAAVYDAGTTAEGRPFFVMELVRGSPITEFCDERRLSIKERLDLFVHVCSGIQHAHQKAVLHRDLKPSNILVEDVDGTLAPKIIDFGIAKALGAAARRRPGSSLYTMAGIVIGTPEYMSPEQTEGDSQADTCSDVYSLGAILYELMTGSPPIVTKDAAKAGFDRVLRAIREVEPARPSAAVSALEKHGSRIAWNRNTDQRKLGAELRGDLDWIILKALEKDRKRRYESASAFAADIQRHLRHEPVNACPPTRLYLLRKLIQRNKAAFVTALLVTLSLVLGGAIAAYNYVLVLNKDGQLRTALSDAQIEARKYKDVADFLGGTYHEISLNNGAQLLNPDAFRGLLDGANERRERELREDPDTDLRVSRILGRAYGDLNALDFSARLHRHAYDLLRARGMVGSAEAADCAYWIAWSRHRHAEESGAPVEESDNEALARGSLAIRERARPREKEAVLESKALLAGILRSEGKRDEAKAILSRVTARIDGQNEQFSTAYGSVEREEALLLFDEGKVADALARLDDAAANLLRGRGPKSDSYDNSARQARADILRLARLFHLQLHTREDRKAAAQAASDEFSTRSLWLGYDDPSVLTAIATIELMQERAGDPETEGLDRRGADAESRLREAAKYAAGFHAVAQEEEALRKLVENEALFPNPSPMKTLGDVTALARLILEDADRMRVEGRDNSERMAEASKLLQRDYLVAGSYPVDSGPFFAMRASLYARGEQYAQAITELARALQADRDNCQYHFEIALFEWVSRKDAAYALERGYLLRQLRAILGQLEKQQWPQYAGSARNIVWICRAVLLQPGLTPAEHDLVEQALGFAHKEPDWSAFLMGLADYRAGTYDAAEYSEAEKFFATAAQAQDDAAVWLPGQIGASMTARRLQAPGAQLLFKKSEELFTQSFAPYRGADSVVRVYDFLTARLLLDEARVVVVRPVR